MCALSLPRDPRLLTILEEVLKLAVGGRCLHDVGHSGSEQLEFEVRGVKRVHFKEFLENGVRIAGVLRRNRAEMNFGLGVVDLHPKSFCICGNVRRRKVFLSRRGASNNETVGAAEELHDSGEDDWPYVKGLQSHLDVDVGRDVDSRPRTEWRPDRCRAGVGIVHIDTRLRIGENWPATSRSSPVKQVVSIRATCRDGESEEGSRWIGERKGQKTRK